MCRRPGAARRRLPPRPAIAPDPGENRALIKPQPGHYFDSLGCGVDCRGMGASDASSLGFWSGPEEPAAVARDWLDKFALRFDAMLSL